MTALARAAPRRGDGMTTVHNSKSRMQLTPGGWRPPRVGIGSWHTVVGNDYFAHSLPTAQ
jgi:hypothetical protein